MASKTSEKFKVNRGTAGGDSFYVTDVTTLADGSVKRETYRSDNKGNNKVLVQTVQVDKDGKLTKDEISSIEEIVNRELLNNVEVQTEVMNLDDAINSGAQALFGEKYEDEVRVLTMGEKSFSVELCGGTHVERTGDIGVFVIVNQSSVASGVRRIEAIGGKQALEYINEVREVTDSLQSKLNVPADALLEKVEALIEENKKLKKSGGSQPNPVKVIFSETYDINDWQLQV